MHILELNFERTWRGGERQTLYNMQGFVQKGIAVSLVCRKGYPLEEKAKAAGFTVHAFNNIFQVLAFFMFQCRKYDVFHAQTSHILTYCLLTKPFHGARIVFTRRVDFVPHGWLTKKKYQLTDKIVAISTAVKNIVETFCGKNVTVIPDIAVSRVLNKKRAQIFLQQLNIPSHIHIIGTTAALVPHKDPLNMVAAVKELWQQRQDFIFLHFGSGDMEEIVKQKIQEYGLQDVYKLMGFVEDVEDFFSVFEVFVMSSEEEGLGSSVLDAFLYKVPVVSTDAGGLADLLADGRGIMCRKKSPAKLAEGIDLLLKQPELATEVTTHAYNYVTQRHSIAHVTEEYVTLLNS